MARRQVGGAVVRPPHDAFRQQVGQGAMDGRVRLAHDERHLVYSTNGIRLRESSNCRFGSGICLEYQESGEARSRRVSALVGLKDPIC